MQINSKAASRFSIIFFVMAASFSALAYKNPPQAISLVPPGAIEHLERLNQLTELCPKKEDFEKCKLTQLKPKQSNLDVFEAPDTNSKKLGNLVFSIVPGKGIDAQFVDLNGQSSKFLPDSKEGDWGYQSYFEFTVNDVSGDWISLPRRPFATAVWINLKHNWGPTTQPQHYSFDTKEIYTSKKWGDIVVVEFKGKLVKFRKESANDMNCGEAPTKTIDTKNLKTNTKDISTFYDTDGHLTLWPKYTRGC